MYQSNRLIDPVVICPYDDNHLIARSRLQRHIVKCEKNFPEHYKIMCPYNATHRLFRHELEEHIVKCSARSGLQSEMFSEPKKHGAIDFALHSEISSTIDCDENWDEKNDDSFQVSDGDDNDHVSISDTSIPGTTIDSDLKDNNKKESLRPPLGFSEAVLREVNEDSCIEDLESVISSMGIGRGKSTVKNIKLKLKGLGRGRPINKDL